MTIFLGYTLSFAVVFGTIGCVSLLKKLFRFSTEFSRKLIHLFVGFTWLPMYFYLRNTVHFIVIPVIFIILNYLSLRFSFIKSMEREAKNGKKDFGTVYFAICMTVMSIVSYFMHDMLVPYGIAVSALCFGDGAAAMFGSLVKKHNPTLITGKSLVGTISCALASIFGIYALCAVLDIRIRLSAVLILSLATSILELVGRKFDNFTVSFGILLIAYALL